MAKITYYLGAGASFNACPILDKLSETMISLASEELEKVGFRLSSPHEHIYLKFDEEEKKQLPNDNKIKILWHIGYFGKKALKFNTIDTLAKKLFLNGEQQELSLLKLSISVFFDLFEGFKELKHGLGYQNIDHRYISLFSILLDKKQSLRINQNFKFITWNYDLQLLETFKLFLSENYQKDLNSLNNNLEYKLNNKESNDVFHLNGYRGFSNYYDGSEIVLHQNKGYENFWKENDSLFIDTIRKKLSFNNHIKYAWEHENLLEKDFFKNVIKVMHDTEILIVIGYSFPAFNRQIDQLLFSKLDPKKIIKIVYQDPNASEQQILNLFKEPLSFSKKIKILNNEKDLKQFYLPNEHFIAHDGGGDLFLY